VLSEHRIRRGSHAEHHQHDQRTETEAPDVVPGSLGAGATGLTPLPACARLGRRRDLATTARLTEELCVELGEVADVVRPYPRVRREWGRGSEERVIELGVLGAVDVARRRGVGGHSGAQELATTRRPENRSVSYSPSGTPGSTSDRASTYSSQGCSSRSTSSGTRKKKLSGAICVRCASNASRATASWSRTSMRVVVTFSSASSCSCASNSSRRVTNSASGLSSPCATIHSCSARRRSRAKPLQ